MSSVAYKHYRKYHDDSIVTQDGHINTLGLFKEHSGAIVVDLGSHTIKSGFAGEQFPKTIFPTLIGKPKPNIEINKLFGAHDKMNSSHSHFIGLEAQNRKGILELNHPIYRDGNVDNWNDVELLLDHIYNFQLRINPKDHPILLTESPLNSLENRLQYIELLFEKFQTHSLFFTIQGLLSIYANGDLDGIVLDSGDGSSHVVPVFEGYPQSYAIVKSMVSGIDVTNELTRLLLTHNGYDFTMNSGSKDFIREVKEKTGFISLNFDHQSQMSNDKINTTYQLPDGSNIKLGNERFLSTEVLFQPSLIGKEEYGLHELLHTGIHQCNLDIRKHMFKNIILSGGNTCFNGISERLTREMLRMINGNVRLRIVANPERKYSVWIGGSILASLSTFQERWIKKSVYEELGPELISKMLFH
ncbi:hypothetical protein ABK040_005402 [Willaertia magna]